MIDENLTQALSWLGSGSGQLVAVGVLYLAIWGLRRLPQVRKLVGSRRRLQLLSWGMAMLPAATLIAKGAPWQTAITAVLIALASNGVDTYRPKDAS